MKASPGYARRISSGLRARGVLAERGHDRVRARAAARVPSFGSPARASARVTSRIAAALHDGAVEQSLRERREQERHHVRAAGRLAEDRDALGIAAERRGVLAHPGERAHEIERAVVARSDRAASRRRRTDRGVVQPAERTEPVVRRHHDDVLARREPAAVVGAGLADRVAAAVDPEHHREQRARPSARPARRSAARRRSGTGSPRCRSRCRARVDAADLARELRTRRARARAPRACRSTASGGRGARQRSSPVGGFANGSPSHAWLSYGPTKPTTSPPSSTRFDAASATGGAGFAGSRPHASKRLTSATEIPPSARTLTTPLAARGSRPGRRPASCAARAPRPSRSRTRACAR